MKAVILRLVEIKNQIRKLESEKDHIIEDLISIIEENKKGE